MSDSPQVGKNVKFYLDCKIYVAWFIHKKKWSMVFLRGVVQLAFLVSSFYRSNINGYAIRLHITHHSAASLIGHFCTPDHTILYGHVLYSVPEYNASTIVTWERQTNRINRPGYRLFVQFFIVTWWINTSKHAVYQLTARKPSSKSLLQRGFSSFCTSILTGGFGYQNRAI